MEYNISYDIFEQGILQEIHLKSAKASTNCFVFGPSKNGQTKIAWKQKQILLAFIKLQPHPLFDTNEIKLNMMYHVAY